MGSCLSKNTGAESQVVNGHSKLSPANPATEKELVQATNGENGEKVASTDSLSSTGANDTQIKNARVENRELCISMHSNARQQLKQAPSVFSESVNTSKDFEVPRIPKSDAVVEFIDSALTDNFIFATLSNEERRMLIDAMQSTSVSKGEIIIEEGNIGDYFYVLEEGKISFVVDGNHVGAAGRGASFGELSLLYESPRTATCIANTDCKLWKVDQHTFQYMLANKNLTDQTDTIDVLRKVQFLSKLEDSLLSKIADALTTVRFQEGETIFNKGDVGEVFYIVKEGRVKMHDIGSGESQFVDQFLGPGDSFGEKALLSGEPRLATATAEIPSVTLCVSRENFERILGPLKDLLNWSMNKRVLMGVPIFANSHFEPHEMDRLTELITEVTFPAGTVLAQEGQPAKQNLYIIHSGKIVLAQENGTINSLTQGDHFGGALLALKSGAHSRQTITAEIQTSCGVLTRSSIESVIGDMSRLGKTVSPRPHTESKLKKSIELPDLDKLQVLGDGSFGNKVWLVSHKLTSQPYALKVINKRKTLFHHQQDAVIREKNIMISIDHPFIVDLICTFKDDFDLYLLLEFVQGGEIYSIIQAGDRDGIPSANARFYAACILEALSHLHNKNITYRGLKPENVLIDRTGYCILIDFGLAKFVNDKTYTLCGTPEYLAPEMILLKGHNKGVDYWAFGVLIYEMLVGYSPFYSPGTDQVSQFRSIVEVKYTFPPGGIVDEVVQDLIRRLLVPHQATRFGCLARGDQDIRNHPWFEAIRTQELLNKNIPAPWIPPIEHTFDTSHFYSYADSENEPSSNRASLSAHQQAQFDAF